jgi:hypothetical protein
VVQEGRRLPLRRPHRLRLFGAVRRRQRQHHVSDREPRHLQGGRREEGAGGGHRIPVVPLGAVRPLPEHNHKRERRRLGSSPTDRVPSSAATFPAPGPATPTSSIVISSTTTATS